MHEPPGLERFLDYAVIAGVGLLAVVCTLCTYAEVDVSALAMSIEAFHGEPWRLLTAPLVHANLPHLFAGMYLLWAFGTPVERRLGHAWTLATVAALAAGSSAAEFAVFEGGQGMSPLVYGLLAMNFAMGIRPRAAEAAAAIFVLSLALDRTGLMEMPLAGELAGGMIGAALGAGSRATGPDRIPGRTLAPLLVALSLAAATTGRPMLNLAGRGDESAAWLGRRALGEGRLAEAEEAFERACIFAGPTDLAARQALADCRIALASELQSQGRYEEAEAAYLRALRLRPGDAYALWNLGLCRLRLGRFGEAREALLRAELDPDGVVFPSDPAASPPAPRSPRTSTGPEAPEAPPPGR